MNAENTFGLSKTTIAKINQIFTQHPNVLKVLIYGSRARGGYRDGSDIDLTMIGDISDDERSQIYWQIDGLNLAYLVDLSVFGKLTNPPLIQNIKKDSHIFYQKAI
ncbi:hypothetical protein B0181_09350 [Moraxella caviae]|uniref:Predicted nucleotidyltransferases n=1 Tax=Moraxella caviae TaxID=34060 RepID=A0A1S9ZWI0_9GAMM|nr:nucleotidyltransferase domain-containing protein [Moraxella caviae]OOR87896.1 hypothetical protein B0181_09350 [Moraxella caviae]STZ14605.1 Predicted nucleotidyltransferases [Moraxella caviae]VEW11374.1 Predicted nucleotidyltransferases [Moraxella caviae]